MRTWSILLGLLVAVPIAACATPLQGKTDAGSTGPSSAPAAPKQVTVGILQEPKGWAPWGANTSAGGTLQPPSFITRTLSQLDDKGIPQTALAAALPVFGTPDWTVNPDGSMDQNWKLQ